ncbi:GIY-YIG nuclease family protein [Lysinibacillus mangiferihumi]|uniref:GIY-YIG nuclease family protein n=1 Tax=Lysinibacillus mangiferihumi TaxID=1130819 RepID=A0A4U2Z586_9BACI|nr:GIY-YIG nuclease family protein [Lysinibacillus mangiferihumi]TKI69446.1 GIY-YIG nuclease family protein [Lysinibacillus mangiferihumi]
MDLRGPFAKKGGVYFFPEGNEMYVGKAKNLYKRLYQHLNKEKLEPAVLDKVGFIHDPNALTDKDLFKLEDDLIEIYELEKFNPDKIELSNKINSPGKNIKKGTRCKP